MKPKFPLTVKRGNVAVKIYRQRNAGRYTSFVVAHYDMEGVFRRDTFADLGKARDQARSLVDQLSQGKGFVLTLEGAERLRYLRAIEALEPLVVHLETAASEYAHASQLLGGKG